jgi:hypothetical protein
MRRLAFTLVLALAARVAPAQVMEGGSDPIGQGSGSLSDVSTSVHNHTLSLHEASVGSVHSGSVRDASVGSMLSGPVSEISAGPVSGSGGTFAIISVDDATVGAVKKDRDAQLGERIAEPLHDLRSLRDQLLAIEPVPQDSPQFEGSSVVQADAGDADLGDAPADEAAGDPPSDNAVVDDTEPAPPDAAEAPQEEDPGSPDE